MSMRAVLPAFIFFLGLKVAFAQGLGNGAVQWTALGDSFAAGPGAGDEFNTGGGSGSCWRRNGAYPVQLSRSPLLSRHDFSFIACSGAETEHVVSPDNNGQVDQLTLATHDMVTLSIGGNDVGFSKIVDSCVFQYWRKESDCGPDLAEAERLINGIDNTLVAVYSTILRKVQDSGGRPNFKLIVTGYPTFFNSETPECDKYSFAFWSPLNTVYMTRDRRDSVNRLVTLMNEHINAAVERTKTAWGSNSITFVDYNHKFNGHRFCEPGVVEPDNKNENTWIFLLLGKNTDSPPPTPGPPVNISPEDCQAILDGDYPPFGDTWGRHMICGIVKGLADGQTLAPWLNDTGAGFVFPPEDYAKAFHPKTAGHEAIKQAVEEKIQEPDEGVTKVLIMFEGSAQGFDDYISTLPGIIGRPSRKIEQPNINIRGYSTWLSSDEIDEQREKVEVLGVSVERGADEDDGDGGEDDDDEDEGDFRKRAPHKKSIAPSTLNTTIISKSPTSYSIKKRQTTVGPLEIQFGKLGLDDWGLTEISRPPHFSGALYYEFFRFVYDRMGGEKVDIYILDGGANLVHQDLQGRVHRYFGAQGLAMDDIGGHGTCMASQAGGQLGGVAKEASIIPVRWTEHDESKGEVEALFESLQWILNDVIRNGKQGKSVINFSGEIPGDYWLDQENDDLDDEDLWAKTDPWFHFLPLFFTQDIIVVTTAGSEPPPESPSESENSQSPRRFAQTKFDSHHGTGRLIVVGALDKEGRVVDDANEAFSYITVRAPGEDVGCADASDRLGFKSVDGTSSAAAYTSGVIATFLARQGLVTGALGLHRNMIALLRDTSNYAWNHVPRTAPGVSTFNYVLCPEQGVAPSRSRHRRRQLIERQEELASQPARLSNGHVNTQFGGRCTSKLPRPSVGSFNYVGCTAETVLQEAHSSQNSLEGCLEFCAISNEYKFLGMVNGNQCYCGNQPRDLTLLNERQCNTFCDGNEDKCGGNYIDTPGATPQLRMSLYKLPDSAQEVAGWVSSGCYTDSTERTIDEVSFPADAEMTPSKCSRLCAGYRYFGLENSNECFCGNVIDDSKKTDPMACDVPCGGDATHICGGGWLLSVFQKVSTSPTTPSIRGWRHSWCYTDSEERTLSGRMQTSSDMTPSRCAQFCCGWEYFGIENGNECFCGDSLDDSKTAPMEECKTPCEGNNTLYCGGGWRLSVYEDYPNDDLSACTSTSTTRSVSSSTTRPNSSSTTRPVSSSTTRPVSSLTIISSVTTSTSRVMSSTRTLSVVTCPSTPPSCDANNCAGSFNMDTGRATCKNAFSGCECTATANTCGASQSCDLNNCAGTFDMDTGRATCKNAFSGCECTATANTCGASQSCDANSCAGSFNMDTGQATCKNAFSGCECTATANTCGASQSCDLNNCAGTFDMNTGRATCKNWFQGCQCTATGNTCGQRQSCDLNNCAGSFDMNTGRATCQNFFQGCECLPTGNTCGQTQSCDLNNCGGAFDLGTGWATCRNWFESCPCNPTDNTCGARQSCDNNNCMGTYDANSNTARCRNFFAGCQCNPTQNTCGTPQSCDLNGCAGAFDANSNVARCRGNFAGCVCTPSTSSCGTPLSCDLNSCNGGYDFDSNTARCRSNFVGCVCNPTANTCGPPQSCEAGGCGGTIDNQSTRAATCKRSYRGCSCNPSSSTPGGAPPPPDPGSGPPPGQQIHLWENQACSGISSGYRTNFALSPSDQPCIEVRGKRSYCTPLGWPGNLKVLFWRTTDCTGNVIGSIDSTSDGCPWEVSESSSCYIISDMGSIRVVSS